jgi:hypothetical protein
MNKIERALKIKVTSDKKKYTADATALPGMPTIAFGTTATEAKYNLICHWLNIIAIYHDDTIPLCDRRGPESAYVKRILQLINKQKD